ncbi:MFS transporter [Lentzea sp. BCCO 10_0061]|uniref:MFS transporter n=1 Tax=Lentzea sokolovensis TaxID=3095429 RepID=A0ABU4V985_9PSEU|nr:MFS transporter [Lentzea sp. BCCO 10_0061]MDX8147541.1 MFS transporter [Lentzea sp. BCCO 10_0061]
MEKVHLRGRAAVPVLTTAAMTASMLPLFLLGALSPALVGEFGIARPLLGVLVTAGFGVAVVLSPAIGPAVDALGPRRSIIALFATSAVALTVFATASHYAVLVLAVALGGVPQALANPSTNKLIATSVPAPRRPVLLGVKQSGVQLGAFVAGLPLAWLADGVDWRLAVGVAAFTALLAAFACLALPEDPAPARRPPLRVSLTADALIWRLAGFSVLLGSGIAAVNTYVALFATEELGFTAPVAAGLVAVLGVVGIAGRIQWSRVAGTSARELLVWLSAAAVLSPLLLLTGIPALAWVAMVVVGGCAVAANAISMLLVVAASSGPELGRNSALVSAGFFAGFALGPPLFGLLGYSAGWVLVAAEFLAAAVVAWRAR